MKLKNMFQLLGFRGKPKHFHYDILDYKLKDGTEVHFAQWRHRSESLKPMTDELVNAYREFLSEGDFSIDIGGYTGDTALPMGLAVGKSGCVLAFEPNPYIYHVLEKNVRMNQQVTNIKTIMAAVAPEERFVKFEYSDSGFGNGGRHENMSVLRHGHTYEQEVFCVNIENELHDYFSDVLPNLKFIKVDAEGYDLYILRTMINTIKKYRPAIKVEIYKKTDRKYRSELLKFFTDLDYSVFKVDGEPLSAGPSLSEENMENWKHYDIICKPN